MTNEPANYRPGNPYTPMIVALWVLVALTLFQNFQLLQLNGDIKQLQASSRDSSLTPTGPLPNSSGNGEYATQLQNIAGKLDRLNGTAENIQNNVAGIKSDTSDLRSGGGVGSLQPLNSQ